MARRKKNHPYAVDVLHVRGKRYHWRLYDVSTAMLIDEGFGDLAKVRREAGKKAKEWGTKVADWPAIAESEARRLRARSTQGQTGRRVAKRKSRVNPTTYDDGFKDGIEYGLEHCGITKLVGRYKLKRALKKGRAVDIKKQIAELEKGRKAAQKEAAARIGKNPGTFSTAYEAFLTGRGTKASVIKAWHAERAAGATEGELWDWAAELMWRNDSAMIYDSGMFYEGKITSAAKIPRGKRKAPKRAGKKKVRKNPDRSKAIISSFMRGA